VISYVLFENYDFIAFVFTSKLDIINTHLEIIHCCRCRHRGKCLYTHYINTILTKLKHSSFEFWEQAH